MSRGILARGRFTADKFETSLSTTTVVVVGIKWSTTTTVVVGIERVTTTTVVVGIKWVKWFESYMENRTQNIQVHDMVSEEQTVAFGVLQGSVLGPLMFISYTAPLCDIARCHGISIH